MTDSQGAWFLGVGSLCSGLAQPFFAWLSDRTGNRAFGGLGLCIVAILLSSFGLAANMLYLFAFYAFGMIGNGMFHPVAASTIGALRPAKRSLAVSCFFVAGMLGGIFGSTLGPRLLVGEHGFDWLRLTAIPAIAAAIFLHFNIRSVEHRQLVTDSKGEQIVLTNHWGPVVLLYFSAATRFLVNLALVYLYVRWVESLVAIEDPSLGSTEVSEKAAPMAGNMNACSFAGMAIGGLLSGLLIKQGNEKLPYLILPIICAPIIALIPYSGLWGGCALSVGAGFCFATLVPVTISIAQRLMPGRTSLASGLMMGGAWAFSMFGPVLAETLIQNFGIKTAFACVATLTAVSGFFMIPVPNHLIKKSVGLHSDKVA